MSESVCVHPENKVLLLCVWIKRLSAKHMKVEKLEKVTLWLVLIFPFLYLIIFTHLSFPYLHPTSAYLLTFLPLKWRTLGNWNHGAVATISLCYRYEKRRLALCSAALLKCLRVSLLSGKEKGKRERGPFFFTPHSTISLVSRLYPDTINLAFHLFLALKMYLHYPRSERGMLFPSWDTCVCHV